MNQSAANLKVIWKRPDGFHGAEPSDYYSVELGHSKIWLHKQDRDEFPFRISGGWEEQEASKKLNNLINLMGDHQEKLVAFLIESYSHSTQDDPSKFIEDLQRWVLQLHDALKGDTWEVDVMAAALTSLKERLADSSSHFIQKAKT